MILRTYWRVTSGCTRTTRCRCLHGGIVIYDNLYCMLDYKEKNIEIRLAYYNTEKNTLTVYATDKGMMIYERELENERPKR